MNQALINRVANAVLYEGYILYPYRPSVKNRQRWTFGGLLPESYCRTQAGSDRWHNQTECLVQDDADAILGVTIRFLHLTDRLIGEIEPPLVHWPLNGEPPFLPVESLRLDGETFYSWQEAEEREVNVRGFRLNSLLSQRLRKTFEFPCNRRVEPIAAKDGTIAGLIVREQQALCGEIELSATQLAERRYRIRLRVFNRTASGAAETNSREQASLRSLASMHAVLSVAGGEFVSLLDPPEDWRDAAAQCQNAGLWPVLIGEPGDKDSVLSAPIILYDYPALAPESPGDLFDATEIDEILTLRIMTLTDEEKAAAAAVDERARALLTRTSALPREAMSRLHGTIRNLQPASGDNA